MPTIRQMETARQQPTLDRSVEKRILYFSSILCQFSTTVSGALLERLLGTEVKRKRSPDGVTSQRKVCGLPEAITDWNSSRGIPTLGVGVDVKSAAMTLIGPTPW